MLEIILLPSRSCRIQAEITRIAPSRLAAVKMVDGLYISIL